jgi:adenylylsulfate kinase-like enzyme
LIRVNAVNRSLCQQMCRDAPCEKKDDGLFHKMRANEITMAKGMGHTTAAPNQRDMEQKTGTNNKKQG